MRSRLREGMDMIETMQGRGDGDEVVILACGGDACPGQENLLSNLATNAWMWRKDVSWNSIRLSSVGIASTPVAVSQTAKFSRMVL